MLSYLYNGREPGGWLGYQAICWILWSKRLSPFTPCDVIVMLLPVCRKWRQLYEQFRQRGFDERTVGQ